MKKYTDQQIEDTFKWLEEHDDQSEAIFQEIDAQQPNLLAYLFSEPLSVFTANEKELLVFASLVLYKTTAGHMGRTIELEEIEDAESKNYELVNDELRYSEQIDLFFTDYPQEDLLAFVEDFIDSDEDDEYAINEESRLPIFICLKTMIDVLTTDD